MNKSMFLIFCSLAALTLTSNRVKSQISFDIEAGIISTGYNDVRIPGSSGTFLSFSDKLEWKPTFYSRLQAGYRFGKRSEIVALYAPLNLTYKGSVDQDVVFQGETYPAGTLINATYKFNSYRATYRYYLLSQENIEIGLGLTIKVRDALIGLRGVGIESVKTDLGAVPLINFYAHWLPTKRFGLQLHADALAAPQGRAEDVLLAITFKGTENFTLKAGYRILEGGADNATVYTFSMFHYAVFGVVISLE